MGLKLRTIAELLDCEVLYGEDQLDIGDISGCFCADLMSDVLAFAKPNSVLLTGLKTAQSVHTANVADIKAIIYLRGKQPDERAVQRAKENKIPLLTTKLCSFEACGILYTNYMKELV